MENRELINELENGRELNVVLVSDKKYFMSLLGLQRIYSNLNMSVIEKNQNYINILENNNIDIIIEYHSKKEDMADLGQLEDLALQSSIKNGKRITIGYSYIDSFNKGFDSIILVSYKEKESEIEHFEMDDDYTPYDLLQITLNEHDNLEKNKVLKR